MILAAPAGAKTIPVQAGESATRRARSDRHRAATWLQLGARQNLHEWRKSCRLAAS